MATVMNLPFSTAYIGAWAIAITAILAVMLTAMLKRKRQDGTPFNMLLVKLLVGMTGVFWLSTAGTYVTYI